MPKQYPSIEAGEWVYPAMSGYKMACCDCNLVHRIDFEIMTDEPVPYLRLRAYRDKRATAALRRYRNS